MRLTVVGCSGSIPRPHNPATVGHVAHPVEAFAFRFEHGGRVLAYSGDTGESPVLVELANSADFLLCEAAFLEEPDIPPGLHLTGRQAGQHAATADAGHLVLTHLSPRLVRYLTWRPLLTEISVSSG